MSTEVATTPQVGVDPITIAINKAGVTTAQIEALATSYGHLLKLEKIESKERYEEVKRAQLACRDVRTAISGALKSERDEAVKYQKWVIKEEARYLGIIAPVEDPLKALRAEYDNREQMRLNEEAKAWAKRMQERKDAAFAIGFYFDGSSYVCDKEDGTGEAWILNENQVAGMAMSDEALYARLDEVSAALKTTREINAEAKAKADEEREAMERAQQEEADRLAMVAQEQAKREKELADKEAAVNARVLKSRQEMIAAVGGAQHGDRKWGWIELRKSNDELTGMDDESFAVFVQDVRDARVAWETDQVARAAAKEQQRKEEEERIAKEAVAKAEADRQAAADKATADEIERLAKMSDTAKFTAYREALLAVPVPELKSKAGRARMAAVVVELKNLLKA
jgi:hypothetical protein